MNKILLPAFLCLAYHGSASPADQTQTETPYAVVERGPHDRVWARTNYDVGPDGSLVPTVHSYTQLGTGLHYLDSSGQWADSKAKIDILPNGAGAAATTGQHKAYFPPDLDGGQIELNTPDGKWLRSSVLGLSYLDVSSGQSVMIAELTNSTGIVQGDNVVIYPNAFMDIQADIEYVYTISGFEQNVILRQQPANPSAYGLNPQTTRLEVLTEFFDPPEPAISPIPAPAGSLAANTVSDQILAFGTMTMGPGRAFATASMGDLAAGTPVAKSWNVIDGRKILFESVPLTAVAAEINKLPPLTSSAHHLAPHIASTRRLLPAAKLTKAVGKSIKIARLPTTSKGFVMDYLTVNSTLTNFTFRGDTTYYVTNEVNLYGTTTIEGGSVIKPVQNWNGTINFYAATIVCNTGPYRPAIFTSPDDDSVGEIIPGSTGSPVRNYSNGGFTVNIFGDGAQYLHDLRMSYCCYALVANSDYSIDVTNIEVTHTACAFYPGYVTHFDLHNVLMVDVGTGFYQDASTASAEHLTSDQCGSLIYDASPSSLAMTNCLLTGVTNWGATFTSCNNATNASTGVFQTVGAGNYYLAPGSPYRDAGTTNISPGMLAALKRKTTYPPIVYSNVTVTADTILGPQAQRDTDIPDIGFNYDPIDYITDQYAVTNYAQLSITNGAVIACYNNSGILLSQASAISCIGSPINPNWFVRYPSVQEQSITLDTVTAGGLPVNPYHFTNTAPAGVYQFTKFVSPNAGDYQLYNSSSPYYYSNLLVQNCEFYQGKNLLTGGGGGTSATFNNNLFCRGIFGASPGTTGSSLSVSNNTFWCVPQVSFKQPTGTAWYAFNNVFDTCNFTGLIMPNILTNGYNAYINCTNRINPVYGGDLTLTNPITWLAGPLGGFYQPTNSIFIDAGSTSATNVGLYHFTTQTNVASVEGTTIVDLGYHYVGTDTNGLPLDTNGDGIPDYLEDANGNGVVDNGELNWTNYNSANGLSSGSGILVFTPLK